MKPIDSQIQQYLDHCQFTRRMTEATMQAKRSAYTVFIRDSGCEDLSMLTNSTYDAFMKKRIQAGNSSRTLNFYREQIMVMLRYHREMGVNMPIKIALIQPVKDAGTHRVFYTREQVEEALQYADSTAGLMIRIGFDTGMRLAELTNLRLEQINGRRLNFLAKGRKMREAYITEETRRRLDDYIAERGITDYLWLNTEGPGHMCKYLVSLRMSEPFRKAGYSDFHPHALRHSFATDLQRRGASVEEIQQMIGHSSITTTQRYLHGFEGQLQNLFDKYHP